MGRAFPIVADSETLAVQVSCELPRPLSAPVTRSVGCGLHARLALTPRAVRSITPRGAAPPPAEPGEYEDAVGGMLTCTPTATAGAVLITLTDLQFRTTRVRQVGPLKVQLDNPFPP